MNYKIGDIVFDDWKIVRKIGAGASGQVYEIAKTGNQVYMTAAMKVLHIPSDPSLPESLAYEGMSPEQIREYLQNMLNELIDEIRIMIDMKGASQLVACEDYEVIREDATNRTVLIKMELLTPLQKYLEEREYTEKDIYELAVQMTKALSVLERRRIIHRDIKPENIFATKFDEYKLGDFGIARICSGSASSLSVKGTENYMAPEVFLTRHYDQTVDIYSLGLVLYRLLNKNRFPFYPIEGSYTPLQSQEARMERLSGKKNLPPPVQASDRFAEIILKMCAYEPRDRYQTAEELMKDLASFTPDGATVIGVKTSGKAVSGSKRSDKRSGRAASENKRNGRVEPRHAEEEDDDRTVPLFPSEKFQHYSSVIEDKSEQPSAEDKTDPSDSERQRPARAFDLRHLLILLAVILAAEIGIGSIHRRNEQKSSRIKSAGMHWSGVSSSEAEAPADMNISEVSWVEAEAAVDMGISEILSGAAEAPAGDTV